ncbi:GTP-binding protein [Oceanisphaera sp. IT1-181]|uniref:CobW family GTP-binding protein n=1 Tax=Oceanisphaera sp. IT1-181 TaxID=3081199 RepID=UPI0029CA55F3|nr:GTP-binding protein [Oceanisphaera sp. IT1-181]
MSTPVITHLVMGFLGTGKTTLLRHLLANKPEHERWAILVNEFGEVGIDGALLTEQGAMIKEVPGGCLCCVSGLPFQIGLNALLHKAKPDRLFIEPSGLGHPSQILKTLTNEHYQDVLQLGATFCVVDPRQWAQARYQAHETYQDQLALADVLVLNKADLSSPELVANLQAAISKGLFADQAAQACVTVSQGQLDVNWLQAIHHTGRKAASPAAHANNSARPLIAKSEPRLSRAQPWRRYSNLGQDHYSVGWRFLDEVCFDLQAVEAFCRSLKVARLKAVLPTADGWRAFNMVDDQLTVYRIAAQNEGRLELIDPEPLPAQQLQKALLATMTRS